MEISDVHAKFHALRDGNRFIPALGVWDAYTARVAERLGIECVHLGGYRMGVHYVTSEPLLSMTEVAQTCRYVTAAVDIPVVVDVGAGFGEPLHVMRMVREMERAGASCIQIEDQAYPKRVHYHKGVEHLIAPGEMVDKIKGALDARSGTGMTVMARTDAMRTHGFEEGVRCARSYLDAGAEMVMVFPNTEEEARLAPREIGGNVTYTNSEGNRFGRPTFTAAQFQEMGYKLASYPAALLCPLTQEMKRVITNLVETGETDLPKDEMIAWRDEVEELIGLDALYRIESETVENEGER
ncbi:MAG: isocitrate lyase/PEP mutase family protein [Nitrospinota bacterium]